MTSKISPSTLDFGNFIYYQDFVTVNVFTVRTKLFADSLFSVEFLVVKKELTVNRYVRTCARDYSMKSESDGIYLSVIRCDAHQQCNSLLHSSNF